MIQCDPVFCRETEGYQLTEQDPARFLQEIRQCFRRCGLPEFYSRRASKIIRGEALKEGRGGLRKGRRCLPVDDPARRTGYRRLSETKR